MDFVGKLWCLLLHRQSVVGGVLRTGRRTAAENAFFHTRNGGPFGRKWINLCGEHDNLCFCFTRFHLAWVKRWLQLAIGRAYANAAARVCMCTVK